MGKGVREAVGWDGLKRESAAGFFGGGGKGTVN